MKVLHFFKCYYPDSVGGVEQVICQLAEGSRAHGVTSEVLSLSKRGPFRNQPYAHHITHAAKLDLYLASTGLSLSVFKDFRELASQADIVHYHFPWPFMDLVHFSTNCQKPTVLTYHSDIVKQKMLLQLYRPLLHRFMHSVDQIVATSPNYLATSPILQHYQHKTSVIPLGLDRAAYLPSDIARREYWQQCLGERFFLFVGAIRYYKGLHILVEAMRDVDLPVVIMGAGPMEDELRQQAAKMGLNNIHFLGRLPDEDKFALLELCYGIVFPSHLRSEAFGISLLEGAMYGKPLISSEIGTGTTYINIHQETGLVVPPSEPGALRDAMLKLWKDPALAVRYGQNAQQRYQKLFTAERMVGQYMDVYNTLLNS
ncbi:glycosyltransferase [Acinetobacter sp. ANC 4633]|uniref:glycosyltransferase family 4 protein n=1 Tax=Acinetobacter sp. ANC 4633 TaxID=2529845 RepID=UPI0010391F07|nr:glycosyltransferase family 4 protein [Acinetobacter sp. ANC 4633]TCB27192.1 glycosyltransferase [Acinetobacter sp. ANC 4633]